MKEFMKSEKQNSNLTAWIALFLIPILIFPFMVTGVIRYCTGWNITKTLLPALCITIPCLIFLIKNTVHSFKFDLKNSLFLFVVWLPIAIIMFHVLYNPIVNGLVGEGGDAGNHVLLQYSFLHSNPKEYEGFISLYAFNGWLETIFKLNPFSSFRTSFYILVFFLSLVIPFSWSVIANNAGLNRKKTSSFILFIGLPITYLFFFYILCSLLHENNSSGFFAHIFSIIVVVFSWILYTFISSSIIRIIALCLCIGLCRFTYGLNLTDLLLFLSIALGMEGLDKKNSKWLRTIYLLSIPIILYATWIVFKKLFPVIANIDGGIINPDFMILIPTLGISSIAVCFFSFHTFQTKNTTPLQNHTWLRYALFPAVMCLCSCLLIIGSVLTGHTIRYYAYKYALIAEVLSILAIISCFPLMYARHWDKKYLSLNILHKNLDVITTLKMWLNAVLGLKTIKYLIVAFVIISILLWNFLMITFINLNILTLTYTCLLSGLIIFSFCYLLSKKQPKIIKYSISFCICIFLGNFFALHNQESLYSDRMKKVPALWSMNRFYNRFYDSVAVHTIKNVLEKEHATFGGYIHPAWPQINFMNALFGSSNGLKILSTGEVNTSPTHCVFWSDKTSDLESYAKNKDDGIIRTVQALTQIKTKECKVYRMRWDIENNEKLCWVCF